MSIQSLHILIIEDNRDILLMLELVLQHNGYTVTLKDNTDDLYPGIRSLSPDIILMDMLLSGADGREVCKQLKSDPVFSSIPVIMLSAHSQAREECLAAGADFFIEKPFDMDVFFATIAQAEKMLLKNR
jgi:CheY-like chemotaxis protein